MALQRERLNTLFGTEWEETPSYGAIRDFLHGLDVGDLEQLLRSHAHSLPRDPNEPTVAGELRWIALDGKALRGSADRVEDSRARQIVSVFAQKERLVLGQCEIDEKTNEIPVVQQLIAELGLSGCLFTADALHCQKTREIALAQGSHFLVQVKDNQPGLLEACQLLADHRASDECHSDTGKGHGRIEERKTRVFAPPPGWLPADWATLVACVIQANRHTLRRAPGGVWKASEETAYYLSTARLPAVVLAMAIRGHWGIENRLHYVRDVSFREDPCRIRRNPGVLARLRSIAHNIIQYNRLPNTSEALFKNAVSFEHLISLKGL